MKGRTINHGNVSFPGSLYWSRPIVISKVSFRRLTPVGSKQSYPTTGKLKPRLLICPHRMVEWWTRCISGSTPGGEKENHPLRKTDISMIKHGVRSVWLQRSRQNAGGARSDDRHHLNPHERMISIGWKRTPVVTSNPYRNGEPYEAPEREPSENEMLKIDGEVKDQTLKMILIVWTAQIDEKAQPRCWASMAMARQSCWEGRRTVMESIITSQITDPPRYFRCGQITGEGQKPPKRTWVTRMPKKIRVDGLVRSSEQGSPWFRSPFSSIVTSIKVCKFFGWDTEQIKSSKGSIWACSKSPLLSPSSWRGHHPVIKNPYPVSRFF